MPDLLINVMAAVAVSLLTGGFTAYGVLMGLRVHIEYLRAGNDRAHERIDGLQTQINHHEGKAHGTP